MSSLASTGLFPQPPHPSGTSAAGLGGGRSSGAAGGAPQGAGALGLSPALIDMVYKIDARLKVRPLLLQTAAQGLGPRSGSGTLGSQARSRGLVSDRRCWRCCAARALQKLISLLSKEIDSLARTAIKAELNSLGAADFGLVDA